MRREYRLKRPIDLLVAGSAFAALAPVVVGTAVAVAITTGRPVLFRQQRPGRGGTVFGLYKFRTMTDERGPDGELLPDAERITRLGRLLRKASLDELPSLFNVIKGDMSLVGPRPLLVRYLDRYTPEQSRRHEVRPGVTGWAQIHGRNAISWNQKFDLDVWYVDHQTLGLDLRILGKTISKVLAQSDISHEGEATMPEFMGQ